MDTEVDSDNNPLENMMDEAFNDFSPDSEIGIVGLQNNWITFRNHWLRQRQKAVVLLMSYVIQYVTLLDIQASVIEKSIHEDSAERDVIRHRFMTRLMENDTSCRDMTRMGTSAFFEFCRKLRCSGWLKDYKFATIEEQVAKFLHILGHNCNYRAAGFFFYRSGETISRYFHNVLRAVISLEMEFLIQPTGSEVPSEIFNSNRFYPYFKDCIGALDGTHIRVKVPREQAYRFRGRKDWPTQNVLASCSTDLKFTYVLPGWEGSASDSRILKNALVREDKLIIPQGKYYLVDAGFPLRSGLLAPYRGVRYHLKEYSRRGPQNYKELFNHRHASLRNYIERSFSILKRRFPIIGSGTEPHYSYHTTTEIILACCIIHNFLMGVDPDERLIAEVDMELMQAEIDNDINASSVSTDAEYRRGSMLKELQDKCGMIINSKSYCTHVN